MEETKRKISHTAFERLNLTLKSRFGPSDKDKVDLRQTPGFERHLIEFLF